MTAEILIESNATAYREPQGILSREPANEGANLGRNRRSSTATTAGFPGPVSAKALAMPAHQGIWLDEGEGVNTAGPNAVEPDLEQSLVMPDARPPAVSGGERCQLLT